MLQMVPTRPFLRRFVALGWMALVLGFSWDAVRADDAAQVMAPPPALYKEKLAKLLTPAGDVLKKEPEYSRLQGDGIVLLDEAITYVTEDGKRISVFHTITKALNDAGVKSIAQDSFSYKKKFQRAYLVLAQTIQPDGSKDPIKSDAVFLRTPQDEADDSIYDDGIDLVTIYSNVKPGSITENITVLEDTEPKIPGQYSETYAWVGAWPEYLQRFVVNLPDSLAGRLKITDLGPDVPAPTKLNPSPARQQLAWEKLSTPGKPDEDSAAPTYQIGPIVWLSTLNSWDAFAAWYNGLLKGTADLSPELKAKIDAWTKNEKDPAEILRNLYGHVAREVRYTGFELGKSDLQPHDCMSVWQRQYGDCKDKANLLRAMLAYKGITSWLTLLETEHAGVINQANPDYRQFNHCIVNAQIGDKTIFCDPTITYGEPGLLGGSESDRDVLVLKNGRADWEHTPPFHDAGLVYSFDLQLHPNGELAGWVQLKATGYYSASYEEKYRELTKDQILSSFQDDIRTFFPNSNLADVEPLKPSPAPGESTGNDPLPFSLRAYMTLTGVLNQGDGSSELKFPSPSYFLPDISDYKTRQHATFMWTDFSQVLVRIQLPDGWSPAPLPSPFVYDSPGANFQASWSADKNTLTANCAATIKQRLFSSDEWETLGDVLTNLFSWSSKSLVLTKAKEGSLASAPSPTDSDLAANLPVMPTGEGELNLIDSELPDDGNVSARRSALEKIATLFPSDQKSIVEAAIKLGSLDLDDQKWPEAIDRLQPLENANRAVLDPDTIAWADYIIASALEGENKKEEARALFQKIADNSNVNSFRRGWATYETAQLMVAASPSAALDFAEKNLDLDSDSSPSLYGFYASTAISNNLTDRLKQRLTKLIAAKPQDLEDILLEVTNSAQTLIENDHEKAGLDLVSVLESLSDPATTGDAFARAVRKVRGGANALATYAKLQQDLKVALVQFPDIAALEKKQPQFSSASDAEKAASQHVDNSESDQALGCALRLATGYAVDGHFPGYFWDCVNYAEWEMRNSPTPAGSSFFFKLAELGNELPHECDAYADTKLLQAKALENKDQRADAANIYDSLAKEPNLADGYQSPLALRSGTNWEEQGDYIKAISCYQSAEKRVDTDEEAQEAVLRAAFIQFDNGNKSEAFRLVGLLAQATQKGKLKPGEQVGDVVVLTRNPTTIPPFWENWHAWWPQWQQIETEAGLEPLKGKMIPIIPSLSDLGKDLGTAKDAKDPKGYFEVLQKLAYAARFYPNAAEQLAELSSSTEEVMPEHARDLRLLAISILEPLSSPDPDLQRQRILHLLINYVDTNQNAKAMEVMSRDWKAEFDDASSVTVAIHRVWGLAAMHQHQDLDQVSGTLAHDLKVSPDPSRAITVGVLADIYVTLGRQQDAIKLLQSELTNPLIAADSSAEQDLKTRLDNIQNASETSKQLADGVAAWLKDNRPAWWDYAEPKDAGDPRLAQLDQILKKPDGELQPAEMVKAGLLAPSVAALGQDTQEQAVLNAYTTLLQTFGSQDEANALANSIINNPFFPASLKAGFLDNFLLDAYENHQVTVFATYAKLPLYQTIPDEQRAILDRIASFLMVDRNSSSALLNDVQERARHPMDSLDLGLAQDTVAILLQAGDIDSARKIYQAAAHYSFAPHAGTTKPEFQLKLLKQINPATQLKPTLDALRQTTLRMDEPETIDKPHAFEERRNLTSFGDLDEEDAAKFSLYLIKLHQEPLNLGFWFDFMKDREHTPDGYARNLSLLQAGMENSPDDETRATLVRFGSAVLDIDNPSLRQKFLDLVEPYRDPVKFPHTTEDIRMFHTVVALRTGQMNNPETELAGFTSELNSAWATHLKIRALLQTRDLARLKATLNDLSADQMISPVVLYAVLPALDAVGMTDEGALVREILAKKMYQDVLNVWFTRDGNQMPAIEEDLISLNSTQNVPGAFTSFMESRPGRRQSALRYQVLEGYLDKDWQAVAASGTTYTQSYPTDYIAFWFLGRSLAELGKKDDAIKALTVYCQYSKDEIWYPDAKELLARLSMTTTVRN